MLFKNSDGRLCDDGIGIKEYLPIVIEEQAKELEETKTALADARSDLNKEKKLVEKNKRWQRNVSVWGDNLGMILGVVVAILITIYGMMRVTSVTPATGWDLPSIVYTGIQCVSSLVVGYFLTAWAVDVWKRKILNWLEERNKHREHKVIPNMEKTVSELKNKFHVARRIQRKNQRIYAEIT